MVSDSSGSIAIISTLISSVALVGVVISLLLQAGQFRLSRVQALRQFHLELMRMRLENPDLPHLLVETDVEAEMLRRRMYMNWHTKYLEFGFVIGEISGASVRRFVSEVFAFIEWRDWWCQARSHYRGDANTKLKRRFFAIVDKEYANSLSFASRTPTSTPGKRQFP